MSYILEALRKSERERRLGQVPSLPALDLEPPRRRSRWLLAVPLLLAINAVILVVFGLRDSGTSPAPAVPRGEALSHEPKLGQQAAAEQNPTQHELEQKLRELEQRLARIDQPEPVSSAPASPGPLVEASPHPVPPKREAKPQALAAPARPQRESVHPLPARQTLSASRGRRSEPLDESAEEDALPEAIRALKVNVLAYSPDAAERFAVINMARRVPGDRLPGGAVLVDILADGVVLEWRGEMFQIHR